MDQRVKVPDDALSPKLGLYDVQGELRRPFPIGELLQKVENALGR